MSLFEVLPETDKSLSDETIRLIQEGGLERESAENILTWAIENFHPRLALSASFGAPEGMVLLDMMHRIEPTARVFAMGIRSAASLRARRRRTRSAIRGAFRGSRQESAHSGR